MINDGKNGIFSSYLGEASDKVHGYLLKGKGILRGVDPV
jgi:hypothetical protein